MISFFTGVSMGEISQNIKQSAFSIDANTTVINYVYDSPVPIVG